MDSIFGPEGLLARNHPTFEYRPGQVEMAEAIYDVLQKGGHLCIEAGTGTGKTLAYLVPALALKKRVIISTATKNLQEQLYQKDIPFLEKILGRSLRVAYLKGRSNYVCISKIKQADNTLTFPELEDLTYFHAIRKWANKTRTGDKAEMVELPETVSFWRDIDARSETCTGSKCDEYENCFITLSRQRAEEADIVIVNHHLFFADLAAREADYGAILPSYTLVIFDEAHELEHIASEYFGTQVSNFKIMDLITDVQKILTTEDGVALNLFSTCAKIIEKSDRFWSSFFQEINGRYRLAPDYFAKRNNEEEKFELTFVGEKYLELDNELGGLKKVLETISNPSPQIQRLKTRTQELHSDLEFIVTSNDSSFVYWFERRRRACILQATPINLSEILSEKLFQDLDSVVLTSATLTSNNKFEFIRSRLGIEKCGELLIHSHFNYKEQTLLYLPKNIPDPWSPEFIPAAVKEILKIIKISKGRAFILSTNNSNMQQLYEQVSLKTNFPCFVQGSGSKTGLLEKFRKTKGAVLFATSSFWQGVDVQGEALSCVIIDKLPFPVPSDPVIEAQHDYLKEQGKNPFLEHMVPQAIITLKQGVGRLIRNSQDRGILAILDPRLQTKYYGKYFLQSLPPSPITSNLQDLKKLFSD